MQPNCSDMAASTRDHVGAKARRNDVLSSRIAKNEPVTLAELGQLIPVQAQKPIRTLLDKYEKLKPNAEFYLAELSLLSNQLPKPANVEPQLYKCLLQLEGTSQPPVQNLGEVLKTAKLMIALWAKYGD